MLGSVSLKIVVFAFYSRKFYASKALSQISDMISLYESCNCLIEKIHIYYSFTHKFHHHYFFILCGLHKFSLCSLFIACNLDFQRVSLGVNSFPTNETDFSFLKIHFKRDMDIEIDLKKKSHYVELYLKSSFSKIFKKPLCSQHSKQGSKSTGSYQSLWDLSFAFFKKVIHILVQCLSCAFFLLLSPLLICSCHSRSTRMLSAP